jgi:hypothetical protein
MLAKPFVQSAEELVIAGSFVGVLKAAGLVVPCPTATTTSPMFVTSPPSLSFAQKRAVIDYRLLNMWIAKVGANLQQMAHLEAALASSGGVYWAVLDLCKGFLQCPLSDELSALATFQTPHLGCFRPLSLPLGLHLGPGLFQNRMETVIGDLWFVACVCWLDDLLVWGRTPQEFLDRLRAVFERLSAANLKVSFAKSIFCSLQVKWCGRLISSRGISALPARVQGLASLPVPRTCADLIRLLAGANFVRTHIPGYAAIVDPLLQLQVQVVRSSKSKRLRALSVAMLATVWLPLHDVALENLRLALLAAVCLSFPDPEQALCLFTDASDGYHGAVLLQAPMEQVAAGLPVEEVSFQMLACHSGRFAGSSVFWSTCEKELA